MQLFVLSLIPLAAFVILIILIAKTTGNSTRIGNLEWEVKKLRDLERHVNELSGSIDTLKQEIDELTERPSARKKAAAPERIDVPIREIPQFTPIAPPPAVATPKHPLKPAEAAVPSRTREEWEALIGGKLLNRIGALALIIGIGFFLKYAFDNNWINETARVLTGAVIGFVCLGGGYRTHKRDFQIFAQGLVGAGIAILYLSVYAAFNFYQLVPQWVAFILMSLVTVIAFVNGLFYDSLAEGLLGWAGGFLTPFLLSTGQANEVGLFTYIALLDAGMLAVVIRKDQWTILEPLAFAGTWIMYLMWRDPYYTDADLWITVFFVTIFWLLFIVPDIVRSRKTSSGEIQHQILPALNTLFYFLAVYFLINKDNHAWMGLVTLLLAAVYLVIFVAQQRRGDLQSMAAARYQLTAASLLVIATSIQFSDFDTVIVWSVEAAVFLWCSRRWNVPHIETSALVLFGLAACKLIVFTESAFAYSPISQFTLILNQRALAFAVLAGALGFGGFTIDRSGLRKERISNALNFAWCAVLFLLVTAETYDFFRLKMLGQPGEIQERLAFFRMMTFGVVWITVSLPLVLAGVRKKLMPLLVSGLVFGLLAVVFGAVKGIAYDPIESFTPLYNVRMIALVLLATGLLLQTQFIQKSPDAFDWLKDIRGIVQVGIVIIIFVLLTGETRDFFQKDIALLSSRTDSSSVETSRLGNLQQMSLSGVWLVYSALLMSVGIWRKYRGMRFVAIVVFGLTILKIFIYDLSFLETLYRIFSFVGLGVILIAVSYAYQKYKHIIVGKT